MDCLDFDSVDEKGTYWLERLFEESEVLEVAKCMNYEKALGSDGLSISFFHVCWDVIKTYIIGVFHDFHARNKFEKSLNATFITLIPKKSG
jgi:hypothetical protein